MARIHTSGRDPWSRPKQTQWQAQRMRGPILPMEEPRRVWWPFRRSSKI